MKLKSSLYLCVVNILVVIYYCKAKSTDELQIRKRAELEVSQIIFMKEKIEKIRNRSAEVKSSVPEYYNEIAKIEEDPKIVEMKETLKNTILMDLAYKDCLHLFNEKLNLFVNDTMRRFDGFVSEQLGVVEIHLEKYSKELEEIRNRLEKHLDEELEDCRRDSSSCKIDGLYAQAVDDKYKEIGYMEFSVDKLISNVVQLFKQTTVFLFVKELVLDPVNECLNVGSST